MKKTAQALIMQVRQHIGPFASPKRIVVVSDLPKTRSGKSGFEICSCVCSESDLTLVSSSVMRRVLRKIANGDVTSTSEEDMAKLGDLSTLADPSIVPSLIQKVHGK